MAQEVELLFEVVPAALPADAKRINVSTGRAAGPIRLSLKCVAVALLLCVRAIAGEPGGDGGPRPGKDEVRDEETTITVANQALNPVSDLLFGQFLERPSWGGETGPEAALLPGTRTLDPRVVSHLRAMEIPLVRFPGGTDVDYLDWRDMVTDAHGKGAGRPVGKGHRGDAITNNFGYDEFFRLAMEMKWKTILVVNLRDGLLTGKTPAEAAKQAAELLAYCSGATETAPEELRRWPTLRAANGHPEPYPVDYVQLGNETWWADAMKEKHGEAWIEAWADTVQLYVDGLRRIRPGVKIIADGYPLEIAAELHRRRAGVDFYALHRYYGGIGGLFTAEGTPFPEAEATARQVWETLTHSTETNADGLAEWQDRSIDQARRLGYKLAFTEWNLNASCSLSRRDELFPGSGACGLGAAVMLNAMLRRSDTIELGTQSMLMGRRWGITGIRVQPDIDKAPVVLPTAEVVTLYRKHHGDRLLRVRYEGAAPLWKAGVFFSQNRWPCAEAALVDVVATRNDGALYLHVLNTDFGQARRLTVRLEGFGGLGTRAALHRLRFRTRDEQQAANAWSVAETEDAAVADGVLSVTLPPRSATVVVLALEDDGA